MPLDLFEPFTLGDLKLANRMVMAPMTRNRADAKRAGAQPEGCRPTSPSGGPCTGSSAAGATMT